MIGKYLTSLLLEKGYSVSHLSRKQDQFGRVRVYRWDPEKGIIDPSLFQGVDHIIHLAGANIGESRWTSKRKEEIVRSRVDSSNLLYRTIHENGIQLKTFISASAVGYYGSATTDKIYEETDQPGSDFLAKTCIQWEETAEKFEKSDIRTVKVRTAVVLEKSDSALSRLMMPAKFGFLVHTGNGRQYMPWVHIMDLCNIYLKAIEDQTLSGAYNAVAPQHVTHKEFVKNLAQVMGKPVFPVPVPGPLLRGALGEMSDVVLKGSRVSSDKIIRTGFSFSFGNLGEALTDILK
jgi:hypothetical protein